MNKYNRNNRSYEKWDKKPSKSKETINDLIINYLFDNNFNSIKISDISSKLNVPIKDIYKQIHDLKQKKLLYKTRFKDVYSVRKNLYIYNQLAKNNLDINKRYYFFDILCKDYDGYYVINNFKELIKNEEEFNYILNKKYLEFDVGIEYLNNLNEEQKNKFFKHFEHDDKIKQKLFIDYSDILPIKQRLKLFNYYLNKNDVNVLIDFADQDKVNLTNYEVKELINCALKNKSFKLGEIIYNKITNLKTNKQNINKLNSMILINKLIDLNRV